MDVVKFYRTIRHVPKRQLFRRLSLAFRRRFTMSSLGSQLRVRRFEPVPPIAAELPTAIFPPRKHLVVYRDAKPCLFQLNRTYALTGQVDWELASESQSTHLERLAFHYLEFLESVEPALAESIILDWIKRTPPWQPSYWLDTWNSYAISIRTVCMMQWLALWRTELSEATFDAVAGSVAEQVRFLSRNLELDICGNHLMKNVKALLWAGRFFGGSEADSWARVGRRLLSREMKAQFLDDGLHFELSPAYHCQVFADVLECASILDESTRQQLVSELSSSAQAIADLCHPDGRVSLFNDAGLNMAYKPTECLDAFAALGGKSPDARRTFGFKDSGFYGARFNNSYVLFDCGPSCCDQLPAHGHGDILAFEWTVKGQRLIVDAGVREYEVGSEREWNRSTRAHNTVTVGNRDQCEFIRNFRVGHRAHGVCEHAELGHDVVRVAGSYVAKSADGQVVEHSRILTAADGYVEVEDNVSSKLPEPAVARLLLHHGCLATNLDENSVQAVSDGIRVMVTSASPIHVVDAKWSPDFGTEIATKQLEFHYGSTPCSGHFALKIETDD